jgi:hypothetical protein
MDNTSFYSVERLMEFGLGVAFAQQMINVMNQSIQQMYVPGSMATMPVSDVIYVALDGQSVGPLSNSEFTKLLEAKRVSKDTLAWMPGMQNWQPIEQVPAILKIVALTPPPLNE